MTRSFVLLAVLASGVVFAQAKKTAAPPPSRPTQAAEPAPAPAPAAESPPPPPPAPPPQSSESSEPPEEVESQEHQDAVAATAPKRVRFGFGFSGGALPAYYGIAWGVGTEAGIALNFGQRFSLRLLANLTHTENGPYATNLVLAVIEPTFWFGVYGLGAAAILGAGDISRQGLGAAAGVFASPVKLRFGKSVTHELSLDAGAILITSDPNGVSAFGRIAYNIYF
ncbi:MAG: hypothetical protein QM723_21980 [Myxococcaceae bacterium]